MTEHAHTTEEAAQQESPVQEPITIECEGCGTLTWTPPEGWLSERMPAD